MGMLKMSIKIQKYIRDKLHSLHNLSRHNARINMTLFMNTVPALIQNQSNR